MKKILRRMLFILMIVAMLFPLEALATDTNEEHSNSAGEKTESNEAVNSSSEQVPSNVVDRSYDGKNATRIPVITYHRVSSDKEKKRSPAKRSSLYVSVSTFRKQMAYLHKKGYRTLSTEEFYLWHQGKIKVPPKSVLITFDDGSYSVIKYALPILKKYDMKATMFMIGNRTKAKTNKKAKKSGTYYSIGKYVIKELSETYPNFEFQGHTWNMHYRVDGKGVAKVLPYSKQKKDLDKLHDKFGYTFLAYPFGAYSNNTLKAVRNSKFKMAFAYGSNGYATRKQNKYTIHRIKIDGNAPMSKFYRWFK